MSRIVHMLLILGCASFTMSGCQGKSNDSAVESSGVLPSYPQRAGDPTEGLNYLLYGDYLGSGIPTEIFRRYFGTDNQNLLNREGENGSIPSAFTLFEAPNGVEVVGGINCFGCHASFVNGEFIVGLGNTFSDYTEDSTNLYQGVSGIIGAEYGYESPEWDAFRHLGQAAAVIGPQIVTPFMGINPAFALEEAAVSHREPDTLIWQEEPVFSVTNSPLASDVPPWWHVQKKNALYYNAVGRGDMAKLIMQICVVGVWDAEHAAEIDRHFPDVLAYLNGLEPPIYPGPIDSQMRSEGEAIFNAQCSRCHGTYGDVETYPNLLVPLDVVGTDPALARSYIDEPEFLQWLQDSWFAQGEHPAVFEGELGYIAPPLDGIWATAPYFHNGSVPNLAAVLDSSVRPAKWTRNFGSSELDFERMGWPYTETEEGVRTYNTALSGYGNQGHTFGDGLTETQRQAVLEYLKSL